MWYSLPHRQQKTMSLLVREKSVLVYSIHIIVVDGYTNTFWRINVVYHAALDSYPYNLRRESVSMIFHGFMYLLNHLSLVHFYTSSSPLRRFAYSVANRRNTT